MNNPAETVENKQLFYSWKAPIRAYKHRSTGVLRFYIALTLLLAAIAYFFGDKVLMFPIAATLFLFYVLTISEPPIIENRITKFGLETGGNTYRWENLSHFYYYRKFDYYMITLIGHPPLYSHVYVVVPDDSTLRKVLDLVSEHIVFQEVPDRSLTDAILDILNKLMPEEEKKTKPQNETSPDRQPTH